MGLILLKDSASNPDVLIRTDYKPKKRNLTHIHSYVAHPKIMGERVNGGMLNIARWITFAAMAAAAIALVITWGQ
jgi:hypothetical protein